MNKPSDLFPPVPTCSRNRSSSTAVTCVPPVPNPGESSPVGDIPGGNRSPSNGEQDAPFQWHPPTPETAPRLWPAWQTLLTTLADGEWHPRRDLIDTMVAHSDIVPKTASNLIGAAARHGLIARKRRGGTFLDRLTPDALTTLGDAR